MARHRAARPVTPAHHRSSTPPRFETSASPATTHQTHSPQPSAPTPLLGGSDRLLRLQEVIALASISRATIYRYLGAGTFPSPLQIGPRRVAWRASDINAWFARLHTT